MKPSEAATLWALLKELSRLADRYGRSDRRTVAVSERIDVIKVQEQRELMRA
jgi:hypothetical protein